MTKQDQIRRRALLAMGSAGTLGMLGACATPSPVSEAPVKRLGRVMVVGARACVT